MAKFRRTLLGYDPSPRPTSGYVGLDGCYARRNMSVARIEGWPCASNPWVRPYLTGPDGRPVEPIGGTAVP
jgi:hypothetical protein